MDTKLRNKLLTIASAGLMIAGLIFIMISIFSESKNNNCLFAALVSIVLGNLFSIIKNLNQKEK